jgi:hypothetical protein
VGSPIADHRSSSTCWAGAAAAAGSGKRPGLPEPWQHARAEVGDDGDALVVDRDDEQPVGQEDAGMGIGQIRAERRLGVARDFDLTETAVREWVKQAERNTGTGDGGLTCDERQELTELRRENRRLREDVDIPQRIGHQQCAGLRTSRLVGP